MAQQEKTNVMAIIRKIAAVMSLFLCAPLHAQDADEARRELETLRQTTVKMIETMVQSGIITKEKAEELLREARREAAKATSPGQTAADKEKVIRVPYVPQMVKDNIKEEIRQEVVEQAKKERWGEPGALPEWLSRIEWEGDIRLRFQHNQLDDLNFQNFYLDVQGINSGASASPFLNTTESFDQYRIRLRLGMKAKLTDSISAGLRLVTGSGSNPVSDNQTMGTTFNRTTLLLDRAYVKYDNAGLISASGGRIENPFLHTDLVWDDDLSFEGFATSLRPMLGGGRPMFVTVGVFPLETQDCGNAGQISDCHRNKWLYGAQVGFEHALGKKNKFKFGLAIYDFKNIAGSLNDPALPVSSRAGIPKFVQKGNSMFNVVTNGGNQLLGLAADFREVNLTGALEVAEFDPVRITLVGDFVKNIGYKKEEIRNRTGGQPPIVNGPIGSEFEARTEGWQAVLAIGQPRTDKAGDWQISGGYKYLERDAVVDAFTDSDFHLGGTDAKGWILGVRYGLANNTWLRARWLSANEIDGPPLSIDVLQIDLNAKF
jgi:Putative porin